MPSYGTWEYNNRNALVKKYTGGPEIRLVIVNGKPEKETVILHYKMKSNTKIAFLFSLKAQSSQLIEYLAELTKQPRNEIEVSFARQMGGVMNTIKESNETLESRGVDKNTIFEIEKREPMVYDGFNDEEYKKALEASKSEYEQDEIMKEQIHKSQEEQSIILPNMNRNGCTNGRK